MRAYAFLFKILKSWAFLEEKEMAEQCSFVSPFSLLGVTFFSELQLGFTFCCSSSSSSSRYGSSIVFLLCRRWLAAGGAGNFFPFFLSFFPGLLDSTIFSSAEGAGFSYFLFQLFLLFFSYFLLHQSADLCFLLFVIFGFINLIV